ncbi:MAG: acryloyl-CoA reductase [Chloroflexi bacterium AL-N5]|nr:acryloyl-CoA reductase [Chloroflexi bacterium AL-N5]
MNYRALRVEEQNGAFFRSVKELSLDQLPAGDVCIQVAYSSLNYKDALSATGNKGVSKTFPHTPGIDAAGIVTESADQRFSVGDAVIVTGYDLGMNTPGGYAEYIRVPADWPLLLPQGLSLRETMILGTAGLTAALGVAALEQQGFQDGPVLVTGASGGVGSIAVALLASLNKDVVAATGKIEAQPWLKKLGASRFLGREDLNQAQKLPLLKGQFGGAIDTVGGIPLENIIKQLKPHASVAACGLVAGAELNLTVFPFILRGVNLLGIDSQNCLMDRRQALWQKLATEWKVDLSPMVTEVGLEELEPHIHNILQGQSSGRVLVRIGGE